MLTISRVNEVHRCSRLHRLRRYEVKLVCDFDTFESLYSMMFVVEQELVFDSVAILSMRRMQSESEEMMTMKKHW